MLRKFPEILQRKFFFLNFLSMYRSHGLRIRKDQGSFPNFAVKKFTNAKFRFFVAKFFNWYLYRGIWSSVVAARLLAIFMNLG